MKRISTYIANNKVNIIILAAVLTLITIGWVITWHKYDAGVISYGF